MTVGQFIPATIVPAEPGDPDQRRSWVGLPCSGRVSSGYGANEQNRIDAGWGEHNATDIAAACGEVIRCPYPGRVHFAFGDGVGGTEEGSLGTFLVLEHWHPVTGKFFTAYAHLLMQAMVAIGDVVQQGQAIGLVGYSGDVHPQGPAGAHLHFAVLEGLGYVNRTDDTYTDPETCVGAAPIPYLPPAPALPVPGDELPGLTSQGLLVMQYTPLGTPDGSKVVAVFPRGYTRTYEDYRHDDGRRSPFMVPAGSLVAEYVVMRFLE